MSEGQSAIWRPGESRVATSNIQRFLLDLTERSVLSTPSFEALYRYSVTDLQGFWREAAAFLNLQFTTEATTVVEESSQLYASRFFPGASLNFAQHLLRAGKDADEAIVFRGEEAVRLTLTYRELRAEVAALQQWLLAQGIKPGDRVAGIVANAPHAITCMLAATSIGAVWSSCSPDFGVPGILDRLSQTEPRILICTDGYFHKGKWIDVTAKSCEVLASLPSCSHLVFCSYHGDSEPRLADIATTTPHTSYGSIIEQSDATEIEFRPFDFDHPLLIMFSSGTTGKPKCIVHRAGGVLLEHLKELSLHTDLKRSDVFFYQTTCGWMMWNWLVSGLSQGSTLLLYDGSPIIDEGRALLSIIEDENVSILGTNPKYLSLLEKAGVKPSSEIDCSKIHTILSTGSPLPPESFEYVYESFHSDICLSSIAGGTDIIGCFTLGCPILPVYSGETQCLSLGLDVQVFDTEGGPVTDKQGELVCRNPFPSMPLCFWNDEDNRRYSASYFERYPQTWHHGDFVTLTGRGTMIFHGRSDAVLNPGGVRIGTAEIYRQVEQFSEIKESIVIGQEWEGDVRIILFVVLQPGAALNEELQGRIKKHIRKQASPFHVPRFILTVNDVPRTRSGKITELAVREVVHGREVKNVEALANPEALEEFRNRSELNS